MSDLRFETSADTSTLDRQMDAAENRSTRIQRTIARNLRRTAEIGIQTVRAFGIAIDQSYILGVQAAVRTIELVLAIQAAESLAVYGLAKAGLSAAAIAAILIQIALIEEARADSAAQFAAITSILTQVTY